MNYDPFKPDGTLCQGPWHHKLGRTSPASWRWRSKTGLPQYLCYWCRHDHENPVMLAVQDLLGSLDVLGG
jgi:hypothetical protein